MISFAVSAVQAVASRNGSSNRHGAQRLVALATLVALVCTGCHPADTAPAQAPRHTWPDQPVLQATLRSEPGGSHAGSVGPESRVDISSRVGAAIRQLLVQEGDRVQRGQTLVRLDGADVEAAIRQAAAAKSAAEAGWRNAQSDTEKYGLLFERGMLADMEWRRLQLRLQNTREALKQAEAALDAARAQQAYVTITSPFDGVVTARVRQAGDMAMPGQPILTLESVDRMAFEVFIPIGQGAELTPGLAVPVRIDGLDQPVPGRVSRVVPSGDAVTRRYLVRISLAATPGLAAGMFGRVGFGALQEQALVLPAQALVERGGLRGVFVVDAASSARFRWVRTGRQWPQGIEITAGLQAGERVLAQVDPQLREGDLVVVR